MLRDYLFVEHKVEETQSGSQAKHIQPKLTFNRKLENFEPFSTEFKLNRNLMVGACLDLKSFMFTQKHGMQFFVEKKTFQV